MCIMITGRITISVILSTIIVIIVILLIINSIHMIITHTFFFFFFVLLLLLLLSLRPRPAHAAEARHVPERPDAGGARRQAP